MTDVAQPDPIPPEALDLLRQKLKERGARAGRTVLILDQAPGGRVTAYTVSTEERGKVPGGGR